MDTDPTIRITPTHPAIHFALHYGVALQNYVSARVSFASGLWSPGCLLAQQAVESMVKAIVRLKNQDQRGHDLNKLLEVSSRVGGLSALKAIPEDDTERDFLKGLGDYYVTGRFGEAGSEIKSNESAKRLDSVFARLKQIHAQILGGPSGPIFVPDGLQEIFLKDNSHFDRSCITSNPLAASGMPGMSFPSA